MHFNKNHVQNEFMIKQSILLACFALNIIMCVLQKITEENNSRFLKKLYDRQKIKIEML